MTEEDIIRRRAYGLYISRKLGDLRELSRELMGMHCWFHRNVAFSALIRGADIWGWENKLTKTWLYRGTLHGVAYDDLPMLLSLHSGESYLGRFLGETTMRDIAERVVSLMEDGVFSRAEMRQIFAFDYDERTIANVFSPWGGIFVYLARLGKVAFRDMTSRDFDLIDAEPTKTQDDVLPELLYRFIKSYGPATLSDAAWFLGLWSDGKKKLSKLDLSGFERFDIGKDVYYYIEDNESDIADIPELTLLSGFDPIIVSYGSGGRFVLPEEYRKAVILKSGICLPTVMIDGRVAGLWNIKKNEAVLEFFKEPPKRLRAAAGDLVDSIRIKTEGAL